MSSLRRETTPAPKPKSAKCGSSSPVYGAPAILNHVVPQGHRCKLNYPQLNAMVATPLKGWRTNPAAIAAVEVQHNTLKANNTWDPIPREWDDVCACLLYTSPSPRDS